MRAVTPLRRREMEISRQRMETIRIHETLDLATDIEMQTLVFTPPAEIARRMVINDGVAKRLRRAARQRIMRRWIAEESDDT